ncbi:Leucine rich adaptor protein 1-like [Triplophysa tibetana]|uniref:Leucine rich adaptor protein 1-like n=1 Tax=Triplophysa tibetana TaxID=1572043 RepID=A0A5A9PKV6_9TELE|nr:Leucine rich adaptor protein 1-like [Triplophysa tibetana]
MTMDELPDLRDLEQKLGRKVPESLIRSFTGGSEIRSTETRARDLHTLNAKIIFLRQQMAHLRAIDVKLMQQLLSINEGIESIRWVMEEKGGAASRESSSTGSLCSLSDCQDASLHGSCSDGLDGISVGSYLDTLGEDDPDRSSPSSLLDSSDIEEKMFTKPPLQPRVDTDEYYCFA